MEITKKQFMESCIEFEQLARILYPIHEKESPYMYLSRQEEFTDYVDDLNVIRILRNTFAHNNTTLNGTEAIDIKPIVYDALLQLIRILKNPRCIDEIKNEKIISATVYDKIWDVMRTMKHYNLTQIPILKNHVVVGIFSENTVFQLLIHNEKIDKEDTMQDFLSYCKLSMHSNEYYEFIAKKTPISVAKKHFQRNGKKRLAMLLITEDGNDQSPLLGILTAWDFIK